MIEIVLTYGDLIWLAILWIVGQFLGGIGKGFGIHWKKKKFDSEKDSR